MMGFNVYKKQTDFEPAVPKNIFESILLIFEL